MKRLLSCVGVLALALLLIPQALALASPLQDSVVAVDSILSPPAAPAPDGPLNGPLVALLSAAIALVSSFLWGWIAKISDWARTRPAFVQVFFTSLFNVVLAVAATLASTPVATFDTLTAASLGQLLLGIATNLIYRQAKVARPEPGTVPGGAR